MNDIDTSRYFRTETGSRGGTLRGGTKATANPPPELARQAEADNVAASRREALESGRIEHPVAKLNREEAERQAFEQNSEAWIGTDWVEVNPPPGGEALRYRIVNFFWAVRPSVTMVNGSQRSEFLLRVAVEPWLPISNLTPSQTKAAHRRKQSINDIPPEAVNSSVRETFPTAFFTLSEFLKLTKPLANFDVSPLRALAAPDIGHENETPSTPPAQPTLADLIAALTNALKPTPAKI